MPEIDDTTHKHEPQASRNTAFNSFNVSGITDQIMEQVNQRLAPYLPASFNTCSNNNKESHGQSAQPMALDPLGRIGNNTPAI
eukprot:828101-Rhodomonas_salina.1